MKTMAMVLWMLGLLVAGRPAVAESMAPVIPVAVAESEGFEAVGRLEAEGLLWFVDRSDSNAPVLGARLEVEAGGRTVSAVFRPERGDYLITDTDWLRPLRAPGSHPLALTLIVGDEADLLAATLTVDAPSDGLASGPGRLAATLGGLAALAGALLVLGRRRRAGGAA